MKNRKRDVINTYRLYYRFHRIHFYANDKNIKMYDCFSLKLCTHLNRFVVEKDEETFIEYTYL